MWEAFQRFRALDRKAQRVFGRAAILLPWVQLSLRLRGFKTTKALLQAKLRPGPVASNRDPAESVHMVTRMVGAAAHYGMARPNCLEQSLVLWYLLQSEGVTAPLRIGVRKLQQKLEAHAWVEFAGAPLNQGEWTSPRYAAFESEFSDLPGENP